jgi:hypothetical protein
MASVYSRAVRKAAELVGGRAELARMLQVPVEEIEKWLAEERQPPREAFLRMVDVIVDGASPAE